MLKPLADKVVVKMLETEETTKSGIILSANSKEKPQTAEVIACRTRRIGRWKRSGNGSKKRR